jgi:SAM-dependent methyltransferase
LPNSPSSIASPSPVARHCTGWRTTKTLPVGETFSVLDVGYGQGDLLRTIARWADPRGLRAQLSGIDLNPRSAIAARSATPLGMTIDDQTCDVFSYAPAEPLDFIVSSQSTHHLSDTTSHNFHKTDVITPAGAYALIDESGNVSNANVTKQGGLGGMLFRATLIGGERMAAAQSEGDRSA